MDFLTHIVPPDGETVLITIAPNEKTKTGKEVRHYWINFRDGNADGFIRRFESGDADLYFSMATFVEKGTLYAGRRDDNVQSLRCLWLDIDAGEEKFQKHPQWAYESFDHALAAFNKWLVDADMWAPNYLVASGEGLHVYWTLDKAIPPAQWRSLNAGLQQLVYENGLRMDTGTGLRMSGILRVPGTIHTKSGRQVRIIAQEATPYTLAELREALPYVAPVQETAAANVPDFMRGHSDAFDEDIWGTAGQKFSFEKILSKAGTLEHPKDDGCMMMTLSYEDQTRTSEPMWRGVLSIAVNCIDHEEWVHKVSNQHPAYSKDETDAKARAVVGKPYTCVAFNALERGTCDTCPHWGKIKSPIVLGRVVDAASETDMTTIIHHVPVPSPVRVRPEAMPDVSLLSKQVADITEKPLQPHHAYFYASPSMGSGIWMKGSEGADDMMIYKYPILFLNRVYSPSTGESFVMQVTMPFDAARVFELPVAELSKDQTLQSILGNHGITMPTKGQWELLMSFLRKTAAQASDLRGADMQHQHYGWTDDMSSFVLGNTEFRRDGSVRPMILAGNGGSMDKAFRLSEDASIQGFRDAMDLIAVEGMELSQFVIGVSMAAPLFRLTSTQGCLVHCYASRTGAGKTTTSRLALSIWGRSEVTGGSGLEALTRDTLVALYLRLGELNSIPISIDEITERQGKDLVDLVYSITQGRDKDRGQPSTNKLRENHGSWTMAALSTGNRSLTQQLINLNVLSEALNARVIELDMTHLPSLWGEHGENKAYVEQTFHNARTIHSGIVGRAFLRKLLTNTDGILKLVDAMTNLCQKTFEFEQKDRYWASTITLSFTALLLGNQLGFWNFDIHKVMAAVKAQILDIRKSVQQGSVTSSSAAEHFFNSTTENRLEVRTENGTIMANQLPREIGIRVELHSNKMFVDKAFARRWCEANNYPFNTLRDYMVMTLQARDTRKVMTEGVYDLPTKSNRPNVWEIDTNNPRGSDNDS